MSRISPPTDPPPDPPPDPPTGPSLEYTDQAVIESAGPGFIVGAADSYPLMLSIGQASGIVVATIRNPIIIGQPITRYTLFRAPTATGPWTVVDVRSPSPSSRWTNLFDSAPQYAQRAYYYATVDGGFATAIMDFIANAQPAPIVASRTLSAGAFGRYPLLGSDVYLDGASGEGVIGPNGDLLAVNGLELLAQDLRTRIITEQGELLLHSDFGLTRQRIIGSGQSAPTIQAQALQARFVDALIADPRVSSIDSLTISRVSFDAWTISVVLIAIGSEDAHRLNLVFPFYTK